MVESVYHAKNKRELFHKTHSQKRHTLPPENIRPNVASTGSIYHVISPENWVERMIIALNSDLGAN